MGLGRLAGPAAQPPIAPGGSEGSEPGGFSGGAAPVPGGIVAQALAATAAPPKAGCLWVVAENRGAHLVGEDVPANAQILAGTDRGVWITVHKGLEVFVTLKDMNENKDKKKDGVLELGRVDTRVLPVHRDHRDRRWREFKDAIDLMKDATYDDWEVAGPKTTLWVMRHMYRYGGTPTGFHQRWLSDVRLDYTAAGVSEHLGWCRFFETAACYDQIDLGKCCAAELGARRLQMIADKWKHKMPNTAGSGSTITDMDDSHLLLGTTDTRGNVGVSPALQSWLGEELAKEAMANKERRKAREERALAAKPAPK